MKNKKKQTVGTIEKELLIEVRKPRFNPYLGGYGSHGDNKKYNRKDEKRKTSKEIKKYL